jgi:glycosyltransferase involved in cell wall biosynthesis
MTPPSPSVPDPRPVALFIGPLPPPFGGVAAQLATLLRSPLAERWRLETFDLSKPQQEGKPSVVTFWDVLYTVRHIFALPVRLLRTRPRAALFQATADTGWFRDLLLMALCRLFGVPVVVHWHGAVDSWQFPGRSAWRQGLFRLGARLASVFVVLAEPWRDYFARFADPERLDVVPNVTTGAAFATPPRPAREAVTLLFVGRVGPLKGLDLLFAALERLRAAHPGLTAVCVGAGETDAAWRDAAAHPLVRAGVVRLTGSLAEERIEEFRRADIFVLPSRTEVFPVTLLEAMAAGLPVVATDVGAVRWILADGECGLVVPPGDAAALAEAIGRLAGDAALRAALGERGRRRQQERFEAAVAAEAYDRCLRRAAGLAPRRADRAGN